MYPPDQVHTLSHRMSTPRAPLTLHVDALATATWDFVLQEEDPTSSEGDVVIRSGTCWGWDDFMGETTSSYVACTADGVCGDQKRLLNSPVRPHGSLTGGGCYAYCATGCTVRGQTLGHLDQALAIAQPVEMQRYTPADLERTPLHRS